MGGFTALQLGIHRPERVRSLVVAATGSGAEPDHRAEFHSEVERIAEGFLRDGSAAMARRLGFGPSRVQLKNKNEERWRQFVQHLGEHSEEGSALTSLGFLRSRPSLWDIADEISCITAATLLINGDEDEACLVPGLFLKRTIAMAALQILPRAGHTLNLEDPDVFNRTIAGFFQTVEAGSWKPRDSRTHGRGQIGDYGGERSSRANSSPAPNGGEC
jgi:pimeloyl-ACP methyl ester carboxylesterase